MKQKTVTRYLAPRVLPWLIAHVYGRRNIPLLPVVVRVR